MFASLRNVTKMKRNKETGFFRRQWNYFKRGKSEINFLLNIYQTLVIIWAGSQISGSFLKLLIATSIFGVIILIVSLIIGKYSLTKLDTSLPYINPFAQDVVIFRHSLASGIVDIVEGKKEDGLIKLKNGVLILDRWLKDDMP